MSTCWLSLNSWIHTPYSSYNLILLITWVILCFSSNRYDIALFYFILFYETRYDVALGTNTLGAKHVVNFAKQCPNFKLLVHVSTGQYIHTLLYNFFNFYF